MLQPHRPACPGLPRAWRRACALPRHTSPAPTRLPPHSPQSLHKCNLIPKAALTTPKPFPAHSHGAHLAPPPTLMATWQVISREGFGFMFITCLPRWAALGAPRDRGLGPRGQGPSSPAPAVSPLRNTVWAASIHEHVSVHEPQAELTCWPAKRFRFARGASLQRAAEGRAPGEPKGLHPFQMFLLSTCRVEATTYPGPSGQKPRQAQGSPAQPITGQDPQEGASPHTAAPAGAPGSSLSWAPLGDLVACKHG